MEGAVSPSRVFSLISGNYPSVAVGATTLQTLQCNHVAICHHAPARRGLRLGPMPAPGLLAHWTAMEDTTPMPTPSGTSKALLHTALTTLNCIIRIVRPLTAIQGAYLKSQQHNPVRPLSATSPWCVLHPRLSRAPLRRWCPAPWSTGNYTA